MIGVAGTEEDEGSNEELEIEEKRIERVALGAKSMCRR